jgi:nitric oxide reductase subunit C
VYCWSDPEADKNRPPAEALTGMDIWQRYNCQSCHQMYGLGGYLGPDLTNAMSCKTKAQLTVFLQYGSGRMPNFHLKEKEISNILAFLTWVDKSGRSKVPDTAVDWTGSYKLTKQ